MSENVVFTLPVHGQAALDILKHSVYWLTHNRRNRTFNNCFSGFIIKNDDSVGFTCPPRNTYPWKKAGDKMPQKFAWIVKDFLWHIARVDGKNWVTRINEEVTANPQKNWRGEVVAPGFKATVGELRALYEILMGRDIKKQARKYGEEAVMRMLGKPADPFIVMQRDIIEKKISELNEAANKKIDELRDERSKKFSELEKHYNGLIEEVKEHCAAEAKKLKESIAAMNAAMAAAPAEEAAVQPPVLGEAAAC